MLQPDPTSAGPTLGLRPTIGSLPSSKIREVLLTERSDLIPLWFGEPDTPTPKFICDAAARALAAGDTFYQPNADPFGLGVDRPARLSGHRVDRPLRRRGPRRTARRRRARRPTPA